MIKNKWFLVFTILLLSFFWFTNFVYSCEYKWKIDQCNSANLIAKEKGIDDFTCITWTPEQVTYQVVLDLEFKKVDEKMDEYIEKLEKNKNIYFWKNRKKTYIEWINDIENKSLEFRKQYDNICENIINKKVSECSSDNKISIKNAKNFFSNEWTPCSDLTNQKLEIFDDITFGILMLNKKQINADEKKLYDQVQRRNYNMLLDIMMINLWYIERIWQKWPSKLANPH